MLERQAQKEKLNFRPRVSDHWDEYVWPLASTIPLIRPLHFLDVRRRAQIEEGQRVLEIGSGYPFYKIYSGKVGESGLFIALDSNSTIQKRSKKLLSKGRETIIVGDANRIPFQDQTFDLVLGNNFTGSDDEYSFIADTNRVLRIDGKLILTFTEILVPTSSHNFKKYCERYGFSNIRISPGLPFPLLPAISHWFLTATKNH